MIKSILKGVLSICITIATAISSVGCKQNTEQSSDSSVSINKSASEKVSDITTLSLPYTYNDSLNPYISASVNNQALTPLSYDGLVKINPDYQIDYIIAKSCEISPQSADFTLKDNIKFWNGDILSASDVIYSFNKAKSSSNYSSSLNSAQSIQGTGNRVSITFSSPNANFLYLCDFPIVKAGSAEGDSQPIGCGRYELTQEGNSKILKYNENYFNKKTAKFKTIYLSYSPSVETTESGIKAATLNVAYRGTLADSMSGTGSVSIYTPLTHLVYIGFNGSSGLFSNDVFRRAFYAAIDRENFLKTVYANNGLLTYMPIYPKMYTEDISGLAQSGKDAANELFDQLGYTKRNEYQNRLDGTNPVSVDLMIPQTGSYSMSAANNIKDALKQCGITVNIVSVDDNSFNAKVASGNYTAYIGEVIQQNDCSLSPFLPGGSLSGGLNISQDLINSWNNLMNGQTSYTEFASLFLKETPFAPLCYRNGILVHSANLNSDIKPSVDDNFYNIEDWK